MITGLFLIVSFIWVVLVAIVPGRHSLLMLLGGFVAGVCTFSLLSKGDGNVIPYFGGLCVLIVLTIGTTAASAVILY